MVLLDLVVAATIACPGTAEARYAEPVAKAIEAADWDAPLATRVALVATVGCFESRWTERIQAGRCRKDECDRGLARSFFQLRHTWATRDTWEEIVGLEHENIHAATASSIRVLRAGLAACRTPSGALSYYATGGRCRWSRVVARARFEATLEKRINTMILEGEDR